MVRGINSSSGIKPGARGETELHLFKLLIDFEGIELEGELVKPQGSLVIERPKATFNPFITVRKDFDQEMMDSIKEIK